MDNTGPTLQLISRKKGFKVVHLNVRSLPKKIDQLRIMLHDSNIDVISVSETWLKGALNSALFDIKDYTLYRTDRSFQSGKKVKRGGGLITYVHSRHSAFTENMYEQNTSSKHIEAQWSIIHRPHCRDVIICNLYRPPSGDLDKAIEYLKTCIELLNLSKIDLFMMGDFNVDYLNKSAANFKKLDFFIKSNGLAQLITTTTRNTDKSKSLIDLILTNAKYIEEAGALNHNISDHQPIFAIKKKQRDRRPEVEFKGRSYRNYDRVTFRDRLLESGWEDFYQIRDPNAAWEFVLQRVVPILDQMCPIRNFKIKNYRPEWVTNELLEQIKDTDYFYFKAKQSGDQDAWNIAKHLRNLTNANIRQAKKDFILDELEAHKSDHKKFWKSIRSVIPKDGNSSRQDILLKDGNKKIDRDKVAHFINDYFINIGRNDMLRDSTDFDAGDSMGDPELTQQEWSLEKFTETEVFKVVQNINVSKSSGMENISSFVVKEVFTILIAEITHLFNLSVECSAFPEAWKDALVIPIPKAGNLSKVQNYRPISLLPLPGKLLEKLVHKQLSGYLENIDYLVSDQHGFRKEHSTIHSVAQLVKYTSTKTDQGLPTLVTYIDFRKAFDCVQHSILLRKIAKLNIDRNCLQWLRSYLSDRKQRVLANGTHSTFQKITQGVPQGSVLGPLFYIIYANDLAKSFEYCRVAQYADDTALYVSNIDFRTSVARMQNDLNILSGWCKDNGIMANTDKTKVMLFGGTRIVQNLPNFELKVDNVVLNLVDTYNYLGITLDSQLNFGKHIKKVITKVSGKLNQFRRMRCFLNEKAALRVYKNMLLPVLEYGDILYTGMTKANKKKLQILQNKGLRCAMSKDRYYGTDELHVEGKLLKLKHRREEHLLSFMYDQSKIPGNLKKKKTEGVSTRSSSKILMKTRKPLTERYKKSLAYQGPKKWNALPELIQKVPTKGIFKLQISNWTKKKREAALKALKAVG